MKFRPDLAVMSVNHSGPDGAGEDFVSGARPQPAANSQQHAESAMRNVGRGSMVSSLSQSSIQVQSRVVRFCVIYRGLDGNSYAFALGPETRPDLVLTSVRCAGNGGIAVDSS